MADQKTPSLVERYTALLKDIKDKAVNCGRDPQEISLVVASKNHAWSEVQPLYESGQRLFGESRLQELTVKAAAAPQDVEWHFIGPLQKNKVHKTIVRCVLIHSVDSIELARKISHCSSDHAMTTRILLQVNTSGESTKHGMNIEECSAACDEILNFPSLSVEGLMTMAPLTEDESIIRSCFADLRELRETFKQRYGNATFPHLSMGMSHDYPIAISEGATLLRIGTALFS